MSENLLLGDEALAQGALDAGLSGCYAYPGTPSTEIMEYIQSSPEAAARGVHRNWSSNEKVAMEEALGMSYAGKRAMVCMKHVGLNVAADGFINAAVTGSNGGLLVVAADDPSMHSSQNEQDSRFYAQFALIPCLEPSSQQEAYNMAADAFSWSEQYETPLLLRLTTRLSHSRANICTAPAQAERALREPSNPRRFTLLPAIAKQNYQRLCEKQAVFAELSDKSPYNLYYAGQDCSMGIICTGIASNYVQEAFAGKCPHPILKISQYPLPQEKLARLLAECEKILVVEEGMPFVETQLRGPLGDSRILGRLSGALPRSGELNTRLVQAACGLPLPPLVQPSPLVLNRPPRLCEGCPHISTYEALNQVLRDYPAGRVFGDIGCYTLGALPPFNAISSCVDMGASIAMAKGAADAGLLPAVAVIGDSTFTHSGMTGLLDAVWENSPITIIIVDNYTTAMTGGQASLGYGKIENICLGLGVAQEHLRIFNPLPKLHDANVRVLQEEIAYPGLSVVIARRECLQTIRKK
ncbi:MAG: indolepyruvate ferredoxin oxidoreductase [Oligosphaeraceae bacterium]|nr:indolepyruvate ferredoxin oxidoreductase [Oligosphaeraceae bacterium]